MAWSYDKFKQQVNTFFKKMYADDSEISSKRVVGFNSFVLLAVCVVVVLCGGPVIPEFMFYGLIVLIGACFGLNTYQGIAALKAKTDVATSIVESDSSTPNNEAAKEIIQADQPK